MSETQSGSRWARLKTTALEKYKAHEKELNIAVFVAGFLFDIGTLGRIDDWLNITQQGLYLAVIGFLITLEALEERGAFAPPDRLRRPWAYRELAIHFLFGSLLSAYTLFYFKSASLTTSFLFFAVMAGLMVANEFPRFQAMGVPIRFGLFSLCLVSYLGYVFPILLGFLGLVPFLLALAASSGIVFGLHWLLEKKVTEGREDLRKKTLGAGLAVQGLFLIFYVFHMIPPVPLSVQYLGIYHNVQKEGGKYLASYSRSPFLFWERGAQTFAARQGDRVYVFATIFSPTHFKEKIQIRWLFKDPRQGWQDMDVIPMAITGGREEGFRGFAFKQNTQPGRWRVQIETSDDREIGRVSFTIEPDDDADPREFKVDEF